MTLCSDGDAPIELNMSVSMNNSALDAIISKRFSMTKFVIKNDCTLIVSSRRWWYEKLQHQLPIWPFDRRKQGPVITLKVSKQQGHHGTFA